jgi:tetratricopeptide (TPR) repeat protein
VGINMDNKEYMFTKAVELEKEGKLLHSIQIFQNLLDDSTYGKISTIKLAAIYDKMGKTESSVKLLERYLTEVDSEEDEIRIFLCELLIKISLFNKAIENIGKIKNGLIAEAYFLLGLAYYGLKNFSLAKVNFEEFLRLNEKAEFIIETYIYLANIAIATNKYNDALNIIEKIKELGEDNIEMWFTAAKVYFMKNMFYHASESIKKAIKLNPTDPKLLYWGAKIDFQIGSFGEAEYKIEQLIKISEPNSEVYTLLGQVYLSQNKIELSNEMFEKALLLNPDNQIAKANKEKITNIKDVGN